MENKSGAFNILKRKALILFNCTMLSLMSVITVHGQNIIGKWKEQTDTEFFAKTDGSERHSQPHPPFNGQFQLLEIKADQTFTSTEYMNWIPGVVAIAGVWSLTGDQLKTKTNNINLDYALNTYTMKLEQDMLVLTLKQPKGSGVSMVEKRYKKK
jgi:hypothetical protein